MSKVCIWCRVGAFFPSGAFNVRSSLVDRVRFQGSYLDHEDAFPGQRRQYGCDLDQRATVVFQLQNTNTALVMYSKRMQYAFSKMGSYFVLSPQQPL